MFSIWRALWQRFTNTGFVFAMWMARADAVEAVSKVDFAGARDEGLEQVEKIISAVRKRICRCRE